MKSNVCRIENGTRDLTAILEESERVAEYNGLTHKQALQLRLLCEEIDGMLPHIIDDFDGELWIEFENGVRSQIVADLWCYINEPRWHLSGDDGTATIYEWFGEEGKVVKANTKEVNWQQGCVYTPNGLSKTMWPRPVQEISELPLPKVENPPQWEDFYNNVIDFVEGKAEQIVKHSEIRKDMKVLMAAFESARTNQVINI